MPRILPDLDAPSLLLLKSAAERRFYEACRAQLPDDWTVLFSTPWIGVTPSGRHYDGEADFIVIVPSSGFLVIEVKGGGVAFDPAAGQWTSVDRRGDRHKIKDPFRQATTEKHSIIRILIGDRRWRRAHQGRVLAGHAVFLTDVDDLDGATSPESPRAILGGRSDLEQLTSWISAVLNYWGGDGSDWTPLSGDGTSAAEKILCGPLNARPLMRAQLKAEEELRIQLTQQQSRVLRSLDARKHAAVCGGAGTGKTILAMERARQLASDVGDTLLLCYNRLLGDHLKTACAGTTHLYPMTFHQLCEWRTREGSAESGRDLLAEAKATYPATSARDLYDMQMPYALTLSCDVLERRFNAIVIDEGQDFREEYWLPIEWLLRNPKESYLYVFYDQNQSLYTRAASFPIKDDPFVLTFNCRNTRHIHESAYRFFTGEPTDPPPGNEGAPIYTVEAPSPSAQARSLHAAIQRLLSRDHVEPTQIAVLVTAEPKAAFYELLKPLPLPATAPWVFEGSAADRGVRVDTVRRFKGLEADVVFLWGIDSTPSQVERELLYVGISRAKSRLFLVGTQESCQRLFSLPLDATTG